MKAMMIVKNIAIVVSVVAALMLPVSVSAAPNTSKYIMSLSGNSIIVHVANTEEIDSVDARFVYSGDVDAFNISVSIGSTFTLCAAQSINNVACATMGGVAVGPGSHRVAIITFKPKSTSKNASVSIGMTANSSVLAYADGTETLNKSALPSITYTYSAPAPAATPSTPSAPTPTTPQAQKPKSTQNTQAQTQTTGEGEVASNNDTASAPSSKNSKQHKTPKDQEQQPTNSSTNLRLGWLLWLPVVAVIAAGSFYAGRLQAFKSMSKGTTAAQKPRTTKPKNQAKVTK